MLEKPYTLDEADKGLLAEITDLGEVAKTAKAWSTEPAKKIKSKAKKYYIKEQGYLCCYCQKEILSDFGRVWDLEHVLCRDEYPEYMFEPRNMAISCAPCNMAKSTDEVLCNPLPRPTEFPDNSEAYLIVHPHFDEFDKHIGIIGEYIYFPRSNSAKGKFTIRSCDLSRYAVHHEERKSKVCDSRFEKEVGRLLCGKTKADRRLAARILLAFTDEEDDEDDI